MDITTVAGEKICHERRDEAGLQADPKQLLVLLGVCMHAGWCQSSRRVANEDRAMATPPGPEEEVFTTWCWPRTAWRSRAPARSTAGTMRRAVRAGRSAPPCRSRRAARLSHRRRNPRARRTPPPSRTTRSSRRRRASLRHRTRRAGSTLHGAPPIPCLLSLSLTLSPLLSSCACLRPLR
jgi:hypothetical protein